MSAFAAAAALLAACPTTAARAQAGAGAPVEGWAPGVKMTAALGRVVNGALQRQEKGFRFVGFGCFFGTYLRPGERAQQTFDLSPGVRYAFLAGGDSHATAVKLALFTEVRGPGGQPVVREVPAAKDDYFFGKGAAVRYFTPTKAGRYQVALVLDKGAPSAGGSCAMAVLQDSGGIAATVETLQDVCGKVLARCTDIALQTGRATGRGGVAAAAGSSAGANAAAVATDAVFHRGGGTWSLYGWILGPGERVQSDPGYLGTGERVLLALSDETAGDIDLNLLDGEGRIVTGDEDITNPRPQLRHRSDAGTKYALEVRRDAVGTAPSLVVAAVLDIGEAEGAGTPDAGNAAAGGRRIVGERFTGRWRDARTDYGEEGQLTLTVAPDGSLTGTITSDSAGQQGAITSGKIDRATGSVEFRFAWRATPNDAVTVRGRLRLSGGEAKLTGPLTMTTAGGRTYAEAQTDLSLEAGGAPNGGAAPAAGAPATP